MSDDHERHIHEGGDTSPDDRFDAEWAGRLTAHLRDELDPFVGSATGKFDQLVSSGRGHSVLRIGLRWSAAAVLFIGIGVLFPIIRSQWNRNHHVVTPTIASEVKPPANALVTSWTETVDAGTVLVDPETPARMLRRTRYEKAEWKDASGKWQSAITKPNEDVILVDLQKQ